jgi:DNA-binding HxlR family transcriptional regulator
VNPDKGADRRKAGTVPRRARADVREAPGADRESKLRALREVFGNGPCAIAKTLEIVGEPWTMLVLREAFWGMRRFSEFQASLKIPKATLTHRLGKLVKHGVLEKEIYREPGTRPREEYRLTARAVDLVPALVALMQWGDQHLGIGNMEVVDRRTGSPVKVALVDEKGAVVHPKETRAVPKKKR